MGPALRYTLPIGTSKPCPAPWSIREVCSARSAVQCRASSLQCVPRRSVALLFGSLYALTALPASALLPAEDEEDEKLVGKAKSKRKERLAEERKVEKSFVKKADYSGSDISSVQNAVNSLAKNGLSLESGDLRAVAASSDSWLGDLKKAVADLSGSPAAQNSSQQVLSSLDSLSQAFKGGNLDDSKSSFASAVAALQGWISDAGLTNEIKGL